MTLPHGNHLKNNETMKLFRLIPLLLLVLLASCRSSKTVTDTTAAGGRVEVYKAKVMNNEQKKPCVTGKLHMQIQALDKDLSVSGNLRMKHDEVIQLSLSLLGFEVGRMEFTPQHVLLIDRVNKRYVRAPYNDVSFLQKAELDFFSLQSLFWNELFVPGERSAEGHLDRFKVAETGDHTLLSITDAPKLNYTFLTQTAQAIINSVTVEGKNGEAGAKLVWSYDRFEKLDGRLFPSVMSCHVEGLGKSGDLSFSLSRLNNDDSWSTETKVSSKYKEMKADDILDRLLGM